MRSARQVVLCLVGVLVCGSCLGPGGNVIRPAEGLPEGMPWDLRALSGPVGYRWLDRSGPVWSLVYEGERYQGKATEVFAYYGSPATVAGQARSGQKYPAVVLVHGGLGQAYERWVRLWADRGYAAIAMDLQGNGHGKARLDNGGPGLKHVNIFHRVDEPYENQWVYHAVANVIRAHSLVRRLAEVDAGRTGVTGISWGGFVTCIVAGLDDRFQAAVPVYGCGFLDPESVWRGEFEQMTVEQRAKWTQLWDPSRYVGSARMPMFFVNGTNDFAYWLGSYAKTYDLVGSVKQYRITVNMPHGHEVGWAPKEIGLYIDHYLRGAPALARVSVPEVVGGQVRAGVGGQRRVVEAYLHYTEDTGANEEREWTTMSLSVGSDHVSGSAAPATATIWFVTVVDEEGAVTSSPLVFEGP